jgi:hypothetical protein
MRTAFSAPQASLTPARSSVVPIAVGAVALVAAGGGAWWWWRKHSKSAAKKRRGR